MLAPLGVNILVYRESNRERWRETDDLFFNHPLRQPIPSFPSLSPSRSFYFSSARSPSPLRSRILGQFVSHPLIHAGKRKAGRGRNSIFPAHCPREPGPEEKDIEQSAKEGNEFSNYPIGFVPAFSPFEHRSKKESKGRSNAIESKASAGKRGRGGEGKSGKDFVRRNRVSSFFFFAKPLLPLHSLSCCRFLSSDEWKRFAFYRASIQTRSNFARSPPLFPPFENLSNRRNRALSPPPPRDTWRITPIVTRPLFSFSRSRYSYEDRDRWPSINKRRRGDRV